MNFNSFILKMFMALLMITSTVCPSGIIYKNTDMKITVKPDCEKQTITGWGSSACWWSQMINDTETRTEIAKLIFSKKGLAQNIYRYNIGGGVNPEHSRVTDSWRNTESFYYFNEESGKYEYDFTRDANAQAFLDEALKYGCIDTVVLFANSPHYSMTISGEASGNYEKGQTNLAKEHYQDFVDYFLTITEYFINKGVPVKYISPINEPQWDWSGDWVGQEGCHYEPEQVYELLELFSKCIDERGLDVKLMCPESGNIGSTTRNYYSKITSNPDINKNVGSFAYHSYWSDADLGAKKKFGDWLKLQKNFGSCTIDMTEWCELPCKHDIDNVKSAAIIARVIANDIKYTGANSWSSWVAVNGIGIGDDGLKYSDGLLWADSDFSEYGITARYYAMAHFSKFITAGSVAVKATDNKGLAYSYDYSISDDKKIIKSKKTNYCAFKTPDGKIVLVIVNEGDDMNIKLDIPAKDMVVYTTDSNHKLEETYSGEYTNKISVTKDSITTIILRASPAGLTA